MRSLIAFSFSRAKSVVRSAGSVQIHHGLDAAALVGVATRSFEFRHVGRETDHQRQVSASRASRDSDPVRIDAEFLRIGPHPADGALGVFHGGRILRDARETIVDADDHVPQPGKVKSVEAVVFLGATAPATSVNEDQPRDDPVLFRRPIQIEFEFMLAAHAVDDVLLDDHIVGCDRGDVDDGDGTGPDGLDHVQSGVISARRIGERVREFRSGIAAHDRIVSRE